MSAPPAVSVVIPTYRHCDYVLESLASVFRQSFTDYEVVVVNDGSPDDTAEVLRPLVEAGRIRYFEQPNRGQAAARNRGIAEAAGEFIALLDDDDLWPADKLGWQVEYLRNHPTAAMVSGFCEILGRVPTEHFPAAAPTACPDWHRFRIGNWIYSPGQTLIRRQTLRDLGGFDASIWGADDWELYLRLSKIEPAGYEDRVSLYYRVHAANASNDTGRMYENAWAVYRKHLAGDTGPGGRRVRRSCRRYIRDYGSAGVLRGASESAMLGRWADARRAYLRAFAMNPRLLKSPRLLWGWMRTLLPERLRTLVHGRRSAAP